MTDVNINKSEQRELHRLRKESFGKYFYTLSQLTFAALVLGGAVPFTTGDKRFEDINPEWIVFEVFAIIFTILFAIIGHKIHRPKY